MERLWTAARALEQQATAWRRDLHAHPEIGLCEYRTAWRIMDLLTAWGYNVSFGREVMDPRLLCGIPAPEVMEQKRLRAIEEGVPPTLTEQMMGGMTGIVATIQGTGDGKTVAFRFDMDCNEVTEATEGHRPAREGFASLHAGEMHACGHDGHCAIGLTLAKILADHRDAFSGQVKLIFQPAEEGVRGAKSMVGAGILDDVDCFFGGHIGIGAHENGTLAALTDGFLACTKADACFTGRASHAGLAPEEGKNALLAAAQAAVSLHGISRHGKGSSRINVGILQAGSGRNVIPDRGVVKFETRGETAEIDQYMQTEARRILKACADLQGVALEYEIAGASLSHEPDRKTGAEIATLARASGQYTKVFDCLPMNASEDCTYFLEEMRRRGKPCAFLMFGSALAAGHHNGRFDFDESVLWRSAGLLACLAATYTKSEQRNDTIVEERNCI